MTGEESKRKVCRKHGITEPTFYRWLKLYPKACEARALAAQGKTLAYLRLIHQMEIENGRQIDPGASPDGEPPELPPDDFCETDMHEDTDAASPDQLESVAYTTAPRTNRHRIRVHGRLPRGDFQLAQISLPKDLHRRLCQHADGSMNQSITGLLRYALDTLDQEGKTLHLYDPSRPKLTLPTRNPVQRVRDIVRRGRV